MVDVVIDRYFSLFPIGLKIFLKPRLSLIVPLKLQRHPVATPAFWGGIEGEMCKGVKIQKDNKNGSFVPFSSKVGQVGVGERLRGMPPRASCPFDAATAYIKHILMRPPPLQKTNRQTNRG